MKLPARIVKCPNCGERFSADSDVLLFLGLGILLGFFLALLLCPPANAQEKPDAPKPKHGRKVFIVGTALLAASQTADAITTRRVLDIPGGRGSELNPLFGPHPSPAAQAGINLGIFAAQSTAFYFTERNRHAWIRWTGRALLATAIVDHTRLAACGAGLNTRPQTVVSCKPF